MHAPPGEHVMSRADPFKHQVMVETRLPLAATGLHFAGIMTSLLRPTGGDDVEFKRSDQFLLR
jgi:hypothetical protein